MSSGSSLSRYDSLNDDGIAAIEESKESKNTQKIVKVAIKPLGDYLVERHNETREEME